MSLLDSMQTTCTRYTCRAVPDADGGETIGWMPDGTFPAVVLAGTTRSRDRAGQTVGVPQYRVLVDQSVDLPYHAVFEADSRTLRVTSAATPCSPGSSPLDLQLVTAEEWRLP